MADSVVRASHVKGLAKLPPISITGTAVKSEPSLISSQSGGRSRRSTSSPIRQRRTASPLPSASRKDASPSRRAAALYCDSSPSPRSKQGSSAGRGQRQSLDVEEEARKAQERIQQWKREQAQKAKQDQAHAQALRQGAAARRSTASLLKERQHLEVYALNAILRMNEEAKTAAFLAAKEAEGQSQLAVAAGQAAGQAGVAESGAAGSSELCPPCAGGQGAADTSGADAGCSNATSHQSGSEQQGTAHRAGEAPQASVSAMYHGV